MRRSGGGHDVDDVEGPSRYDLGMRKRPSGQKRPFSKSSMLQLQPTLIWARSYHRTHTGSSTPPTSAGPPAIRGSTNGFTYSLALHP